MSLMRTGAPLLIADDEVVPGRGVQDLVVGVDGELRCGPMIEPLGALTVSLTICRADVVDLQAERGDLARIDLDAHRRLLLAADVDQADAVDARDLLGQDDVGVVVDRRAAGCRSAARGS